MGRQKCAYNCENTSDPNVKLFKFPLFNQRKLKKWLSNMKWKDWTPNRFSVLCSNHFEEQYIDRKGKCVALKEDAVPTIFPSTDNTQRKASIKPVRKKHKPPAAGTSEKNSAQSSTNNPTAVNDSAQNTQPGEAVQDQPGNQQTSDRWRIIIDEGLMKVNSFPNFFHGDYCVPQSIYWVPDGNFNTKEKEKDPENTIEVNEPWQWLGLDVRGPLPQTVNGHKYILTLTDYYSKWVEAVPMELCAPSCVTTNIMDIIAHFGYPLGILSRLPQEIVHKINRELKDKLKVSCTFVIHHQHTGTVDMTTAQLIDRMVDDLIQQHAADWDVYLPAKVFSLCFKDHSETKERPFSVLCCNGTKTVQSPRELAYSYSKIQECSFVVR